MFRGGVAYVKVDVQVREGNKVIGGLAKEDFRLADQGQPQEIVSFARDREPVSLLLLLDVSGSMKKYLAQVSQVANQALRRMEPGDRLAIMVFGRTTHVHANWSEDKEFIASMIGPARNVEQAGSVTVLNPSILEAAAFVAKEEKGRRAILVITDNEGLNYQSPDEAVIRALHAGDVVLNAIVVGGSRPRERKAPVNSDFSYPNVFRIAEETGGEAIASGKAETFGEIIERLRTRYTLQYKAPVAAAGEFRKVAVELAAEARKRYPRAVVRARNGYYAGE